MTNDETLSLGKDEILGQFISELDGADNSRAVIDSYCQRHPHLADKLRDMAAMHNVLEELPDDADDAVPARLGSAIFVSAARSHAAVWA